MRKSMKSRIWLTVATLGVIIAFGGCKNCLQNNKQEAILNCSEYNNQEAKCNEGFQKNGDLCVFDKATNNCGVQAKLMAKECEKMSMSECRASKSCTYRDALNSCGDSDPALQGRCEVIQAEDACDSDPSCQWNKVSLICTDREVETP